MAGSTTRINQVRWCNNRRSYPHNLSILGNSNLPSTHHNTTGREGLAHQVDRGREGRHNHSPFHRVTSSQSGIWEHRWVTGKAWNTSTSTRRNLRRPYHNFARPDYSSCVRSACAANSDEYGQITQALSSERARSRQRLALPPYPLLPPRHRLYHSHRYGTRMVPRLP